MDEKEVNYYVIYQGEETVDLKPGKKYKCVREVYEDGELHDLAVIDDSGEDYLYDPEVFEKVSE